MIAPIRQLLCAVQFLTTIPIGGNYVREEKDLARSMVFYPVAGLLIGLVSLWVYRFGSRLSVPSVSVVMAFVMTIVMTGGLHIDGFADMCDGFYAGKDRAEILAIMKDAHIGTMAVIGVFCLLLLKLSLLFSLLLKERVETGFLIVPVISRWVMTVAASFYPYARVDGGTGRPFVENAGTFEAVSASLLTLLISYVILGFQGILIALLTLAAALVFLQWIKMKIGGITGDILGALNEISELLCLLLLQCPFHTVKTGWIS